MEDQLEGLEDKIAPILERHSVARAKLFGPPMGEGQASPDVDILVDLQQDKSLLDLVALKLDLQHALGRTVHVVEYPTIRSREPDQELPTLVTRDTRQFVEDILESITMIEQYTADMSKDQFLSDIQVGDAVVRRLEMIAEAVKYLPKGFRMKYPNIRWSHLAGISEVMVHGYFGISLERVWRVVKSDLPDLKNWLSVALREM